MFTSTNTETDVVLQESQSPYDFLNDECLRCINCRKLEKDVYELTSQFKNEQMVTDKLKIENDKFRRNLDNIASNATLQENIQGYILSNTALEKENFVLKAEQKSRQMEYEQLQIDFHRLTQQVEIACRRWKRKLPIC